MLGLSPGRFGTGWRSLLSLDAGTASGRRGARGRGQGDWAGAGWPSIAQPQLRRAAISPPHPLFSRVRPAEHLAVTSISQGAMSLWQPQSPDLGLEVRKQEKRVQTTRGWSSHPSSEELGGQGRSGLKQDTQANKYLSCHSKKMEAALLSTLALYRVGKQGSLSSLKGGEAPDRVRARSCLAGIHLPGS